MFAWVMLSTYVDANPHVFGCDNLKTLLVNPGGTRQHVMFDVVWRFCVYETPVVHYSQVFCCHQNSVFIEQMIFAFPVFLQAIYALFIFSWSFGWKPIGIKLCDNVVSFSAGSCRVTWYGAKHQNVAVLGVFRTTHFSWLIWETWQHCVALRLLVFVRMPNHKSWGWTQFFVVIGCCVSRSGSRLMRIGNDSRFCQGLSWKYVTVRDIAPLLCFRLIPSTTRSAKLSFALSTGKEVAMFRGIKSVLPRTQKLDIRPSCDPV
jgi:hypothetical protein